MQIGLSLPNSGPLAGQRNLVDIAREAEALGVDSLWVMDHLFNPVELGPWSQFPGGAYYNQSEMPYFNALASIFVVAGATSQVTLGTNVLIAVYRQPVELAKQLGTLSALVGDRFVLGVGAGWMHEEFEAVGVPPAERFARLEEAIALMRNAWREEITSFDGTYYGHVTAGFRPVPGNLPILIGGSSDGALRRVARIGDGWTVGFPPPGEGARSEAKALLERLHRACDAESRDPAELQLLTGTTLDAPPSHFELMAEMGFDTCVVRLTEERDLDLDEFSRFLELVAAPLR
jgi:probable F420-dependent oxidoreductase